MEKKFKMVNSLKPLKTSFFVLVACLSLTACETTKTVSSSNYQGSTTGSSTKKSPSEIAQIRTTLAGQYIRQKKLDAAKRQLELAFKASRRHAPAYDMMGVLLQQEGSELNLQKAESYFKKAINLDDEFVQAHNNYGVYLSYMKRYDEALTHFEIAGSALGYDGRTGALENLGRTYLKVGNQDLAIKSFLRALDNNRNSLVSRIELIDLFIKENKIQQARQLFQEIKALLGNRPLSPRLILQGAKLANASSDVKSRQSYVQQLLSAYPLSDEAKLVKKWLRDPNATWK